MNTAATGLRCRNTAVKSGMQRRLTSTTPSATPKSIAAARRLVVGVLMVPSTYRVWRTHLSRPGKSMPKQTGVLGPLSAHLNHVRNLRTGPSSGPTLRTTPGITTLPSHHEDRDALAAGVAGVSVLALSSPAEAKIVYTPAHVGFRDYGLDLNHDGITDFILFIQSACDSNRCTSVAIVSSRDCCRTSPLRSKPLNERYGCSRQPLLFRSLFVQHASA